MHHVKKGVAKNNSDDISCVVPFQAIQSRLTHCHMEKATTILLGLSLEQYLASWF